ncbi:MAG: hypothetical protein ACREM3_03780 [Candidatus Rokuibacteriota bacterium]
MRKKEGTKGRAKKAKKVGDLPARADKASKAKGGIIIVNTLPASVKMPVQRPEITSKMTFQ